MSLRAWFYLIFGSFAVLTTKAAWACSVCFQPTDKNITQGLNNAILFLIAITFVVLIGLTFMVTYFIKHASHKKG